MPFLIMPGSALIHVWELNLQKKKKGETGAVQSRVLHVDALPSVLYGYCM